MIPVQKVIRCSIVADADPITGTLRRGALLRATNPPDGVSYSIARGSPQFGKRLGRYSGGLITMSTTVIRYLSGALAPEHTKDSDVVHTFFWNLGRHRLPWLHENDQSASQFLRMYLKLEGFALRRVRDLLLAQTRSTLFRGAIVWSEWARSGFLRDGFEPHQVHVIPPPVPVRRMVEDRDSANILFIGRDFWRKGGDTALAAFDRVRKTVPEARLIYVGPVEVGSPGALENRQVVHYENPTDEELFGVIYPSADVFLMPTRADAFGISLLEAMSFGIPPVASRIASIPEVVTQGSTGFMSHPDDVEGFVQPLLSLLQSRKLRRSIGTRAREAMISRFSPEVVGRKLRALYEGVA